MSVLLSVQVGAVGLAMGGVLLAASGLHAPTGGGIALALLAAVGQSVYQISWKVRDGRCGEGVDKHPTS